jgi:hypothetical protein
MAITNDYIPAPHDKYKESGNHKDYMRVRDEKSKVSCNLKDYIPVRMIVIR